MPAPVHTRAAKRKLDKTPTKTRMPPEEVTPSKRIRHTVNDSPMSSPIRGPLLEDANKNSPTFVAKCFYGLKKSHQSKENAPVSEGKTVSIISDKPQAFRNFITSNGKAVVSNSLLDELMMERVAMSPVKQAVLETCSLHEFRKIYWKEYKQLEQKMEMKNLKCTRRISNIVTIRDEDDESLDRYYDDSSDDEVSFKNQDGLDSDINGQDIFDENEKDENMSNGPVKKIQLKANVRIMPAIKNGEFEISDESEEDSPIDQKSMDDNIPMKLNGVSDRMNGNRFTPQSESGDITTPTSSGRKFFKTRSPLDAAKVSSVVFGKDFNLKFYPKSPKLFDKKKRAALKRKSDGTSSRRSHLSMPGKAPTLDKTCNDKTRKEISSSANSPSGFIFAPGFLTPEKNSSEMREIVSPSSNEQDEKLSVNKSNIHTYEVSPPQNNIATYENERNSTCGSVSSSENTDLSTVPTDEFQDPISLPGDEQSSKRNENKQASPGQKLFPIFSKKTSPKTSSRAIAGSLKNSDSPSLRRTTKQPKDDGQSQMIIDAGQKFDMIQCSVCNMLYCEADSTDAAAHAKFHKRLTEALKFPGWKKERVMQEYPMDLGRVLLVLPDDSKHCKKKIQEVNQIMGRELGFPDAAPALNNPYHKIFLYVIDKEIAGCCIAEPITQGFRIIPSYLDEKEESGQRPWCCAKVPEPACVGISRLWVAAEHRKTGVATKLVDCVRQWFDYGTLTPKHKLAFSDPTPDGRKFAQKYMGSPTFLVYRYNHG